MKLRVFLPPIDRPDAATRFAWKLLDARGNVLREDASALADAPRGDEVEAVLPTARVLFARLKLPKVSPATIRELLPFAIEDRLLADPSHIHAVAGHKDASGHTLVAVIDRGWLQGMLDALGRAGMRPLHAWPESCLLAGGHDDWNLVWSAQRGMLVDDDGVGATFDHGAEQGLPLALRLALDEAAARGERPTQVRVHTDGDVPLPDLARWARETSVAFAAGSRWETLGAAAPSNLCIDMLQGEFAPRSTNGPRLPRAALALAAAIAFLQLGFVAFDAWRLERERAALEARNEAIFRAAFPEAKAVVDAPLQMKRNLAELKRTRGLAVEDDFLVRLTHAAQEPGGPARSIEYAGGKLVVRRGDSPVAQAPR